MSNGSLVGREHHVYVLAHQDDEYGAIPWIEDAVRAGTRVSVLYLTDGGSRVEPAVRDAESLAALRALGVPEIDVYVLSDGERIRDGALASCVERGSRLVNAWLADHRDATALFAPAWEGGHPDHDAAHAIAAVAAAERGLTAASWQFSLYNACDCAGPLFRVLRQTPSSAETRVRRHRFMEGLRYALACRAYPSQRRTWLGLLPGALWRRAVVRSESIVRLDPVRFQARPHPGRLLYESMFGVTYDDLASDVEPMRRKARTLSASV